MADTITDGRTLIDAAESATPYDDLAGVANGNLDGEIFIENAGSIGMFCTTVRDGLLYDNGVTQDLSNSHYYIWVNCGIVGLLATKAAGGVTIRLCGNTVTDFLEWEVGGSDDWPDAVAGGWVMFVIDVESTPTNTGGTPPATSAIRYTGISFITATVMPRMADNIWIDAQHFLPDGTAGILVQGQDQTVSAHDWIWQDIVDAGDVFDPTKAWGTVRAGPGGSVVLNTSVEFGLNDATTHGFSDTNKVILLEGQEFMAADLYVFRVVGGSGVQSFVAGNKEGTGDDAVGNQGWTIVGEGTPRFILDCDDANIDVCQWLGCSFLHAGDFQIDDVNVEMRSCLLNDVEHVQLVAGMEFARNTIIGSATADGVALIQTPTLDVIKNNAFVFSDGHAVELTSNTGSPFTYSGNTHTGFGASDTNDAALYNNSGGAATVNVDGAPNPTVRNGTSASTTLVQTTLLQVTISNQNGDLQVGINVRFEQADGTLISQGGTNGSGVFSFNQDTSPLPFNGAAIIARELQFEDFETSLNITSAGFDIPITLTADPDVNVP